MKKNILRYIMYLIFLIVFNAVFFSVGWIERSASVWISYGFIHFAYFMLLLTPNLIRGGKSAAVFGFSLYAVSAAYFLIQFVTGIIFILASPESSKPAFLVQLFIAGIYGITLIANMIFNERTADAEVNRQYQIGYVKDACATLKSSLDRISDKGTKKKVERVYDALYSSPVKSHPDLAQMENRILSSINEIDDAVSEGNNERIISLADSLLTAVNERNMRLKMLN